jgi:outer membrane scaffolding protein for murein synthesis (MipA/OmpV family)
MHLASVLRGVLRGVCVAVGLAAAQAMAQQENAWRVSIGGGLVSAPRFPGSDSQRIFALPFLGASYGRFFVGADPASASLGGIGMNLYRDTHWRLATALSAGLSRRKESDDPRLQGLGDVQRTVSAGVGIAYTQDWFTVRTSALTDILNRGHGTLVRLDTLARYRAGERLTLFTGPGLAWADNRYTKTFFGVDAGQSVRSGLPQFDAHGGLNSARFSLGAGQAIDRHWRAALFGSVSRLQGDAASSPITERKNQYFFGALVSYRFGNAPGLQDSGDFVYGGQ